MAIPVIPRKGDIPPGATQLSPGLLAGFPQAGQLPLAAGSVVKMSPMELETLKKLGWQEGEPVPGNLPDAIAAAKQQAAAATLPGDVQGIDVAAASNLTDIDSLPEAIQAKLRADMAQMVSHHNLLKSAPVVANAAPGINETITQMHMQQAQAALQQAKSMPADPVAANTTPVASATEPATTVPLTGTNTGALPIPPEICPHCHHKTMEPAFVLDKATKQAYVADLFSGSGRFFDTQILLGGRLSIQFRTATDSEVNLCQAQLLKEMRSDKIATRAEMDYWLEEYMATACTEKIVFASGPALTIPPLAEVEAPKDSNIFAVIKSSIEHILPQHVLIRAWKRAYKQFHDKEEALLAVMSGPDF